MLVHEQEQGLGLINFAMHTQPVIDLGDVDIIIKIITVQANEHCM